MNTIQMKVLKSPKYVVPRDKFLSALLIVKSILFVFCLQKTYKTKLTIQLCHYWCNRKRIFITFILISLVFSITLSPPPPPAHSKKQILRYCFNTVFYHLFNVLMRDCVIWIFISGSFLHQETEDSTQNVRSNSAKWS